MRILFEDIFGLASYSVYRVAGQKHPDPSAEVLGEAPFLPQDWPTRITRDPSAPFLLIKTHDYPVNDSPAIYLIRDGRAAIHSYFFYHQRYSFEKPSLTEVIAGVCQFGGWSGHFAAWVPEVRANTLFLRYEDLVSTPSHFIPILAQFLNIIPVGNEVSTFKNLQDKFPGFFRRGKNEDYLSLWTSDQMTLFNRIHGETMVALGYGLKEPGAPLDTAALELGRSAARNHQLYLDELGKCAAAALHQEHLAEEVHQLRAQIERVSAEIARRDAILEEVSKNPWVRLGLSLGLLRSLRGENGLLTH